jgi:hypothetical protein
MKLTRCFALLLTAALVGCSTASTSGAERPTRNPGVLTQEEMQASHYTNVYEAVAALRANWMRQQAPISFGSADAGQVVVFMAGVRLGDVSQLRQLNVSGVRSIQYLNPTEAAARFGLQAASGPAIVVTPATGR